MDAVKFLDEMGRMADTEGKQTFDLPSEKLVALIEKWSKDHPVKSYLDVFKEAMASVGVTYPDDEWIIDNFCVVKIFTGKSPLTNCPYLNKKSGCPDCWRSECKLPIKGE